jgi:hypothetical protein
MHIGDPKEIETVLAFFRKHIDHELDITLSVFDGIIQYERLLVAEVNTTTSRVLLMGSPEQHKIELNLHHYSFATVSPDRKKLEIGRLLGSNVIFRLTASEIPKGKS